MKRAIAVEFAVAASLAGLVVGCPPPEREAFSPKCPEHLEGWLAADSADGAVRILTINAIPASGDFGNLPEVHDCQRLITADDAGQMSYGPLGVLFASEDLLGLFDARAPAETQYPARAAATINSWPDAYPALHIPPGWSCLYIVRMPQLTVVRRRLDEVRQDSLAVTRTTGEALRTYAHTAVDSALVAADLRNAAMATGEALDSPEPRYTYVAYVLEVDHPERCARPASAELLAKAPSLGVAATPITALLDSRHFTQGRGFSAARWDADFGNGGHSQHISIRCGDAWCDVMPLDATGPVPDLIPDNLPPDALTALKGWYDQQYLALPDPANPGRLVPGPTLATYFPVSGIAGFAFTDFNEWRTVGYIHLSGESEHYKGKLNLSEGLNTVSLRRGVLPSALTAARECRGGDAEKHTPDPWWVRIKSATGEESYYCSYYHGHPTSAQVPPGMVRWRWLEDDETTWQRCPEGCCPIS